MEEPFGLLADVPGGLRMEDQVVIREVRDFLREKVACTNKSGFLSWFAFHTQEELLLAIPSMEWFDIFTDGWEELNASPRDIDEHATSSATSYTGIWDIYGERLLPQNRTGVFDVRGEVYVPSDGASPTAHRYVTFYSLVMRDGEYFVADSTPVASLDKVEL